MEEILQTQLVELVQLVKLTMVELVVEQRGMVELQQVAVEQEVTENLVEQHQVVMLYLH